MNDEEEKEEMEIRQEVNKEQSEEEMQEVETGSPEGEAAALQPNFSHQWQTPSVISECIFHGLRRRC